MSSRRKPLDTSLVRPREEMEQEAQESQLRDMSPGTRVVRRASFDIYEDQVERLGMLKYRTRTKISDMVREALDEYLAKHE